MTQNSPTPEPFWFGGQFGCYTDTETGLVLCTYRYYDPGTGRWISRDPIGEAGGINLYGYCADNPVMGADPSGLYIVIVEWRDAPWYTFGLKGPGEYVPARMAYQNKLKTSLAYLMKDKTKGGLGDVVRALIASDRVFRVEALTTELGGDACDPETLDIRWNPNQNIIIQDNDHNNLNGRLSAALILGHELAHAYDAFYAPQHNAERGKRKSNIYSDAEEEFIITNFENPFAQQFGEGVRYNHFGDPIIGK